MQCRHCGSSDHLQPDPGGFYRDADDDGAPYLCTNPTCVGSDRAKSRERKINEEERIRSRNNR